MKLRITDHAFLFTKVSQQFPHWLERNLEYIASNLGALIQMFFYLVVHEGADYWQSLWFQIFKFVLTYHDCFGNSVLKGFRIKFSLEENNITFICVWIEILLCFQFLSLSLCRRRHLVIEATSESSAYNSWLKSTYLWDH